MKSKRASSKLTEKTARGSSRKRDRRAIGLRLRQARVALGLTQAALANAIGANLQTVKSYEAGRRIPSGEFSGGLARLGINLAWMLENDGAMLLEGEARDDQVEFIRLALKNRSARHTRRPPFIPQLLFAVMTAVDDASGEKSLQLSLADRIDAVLKTYSILGHTGDEEQLEQMPVRQPDTIRDAARLALSLHRLADKKLEK